MTCRLQLCHVLFLLGPGCRKKGKIKVQKGQTSHSKPFQRVFPGSPPFPVLGGSSVSLLQCRQLLQHLFLQFTAASSTKGPQLLPASSPLAILYSSAFTEICQWYQESFLWYERGQFSDKFCQRRPQGLLCSSVKHSCAQSNSLDLRLEEDVGKGSSVSALSVETAPYTCYFTVFFRVLFTSYQPTYLPIHPTPTLFHYFNPLYQSVILYLKLFLFKLPCGFFPLIEFRLIPWPSSHLIGQNQLSVPGNVAPQLSEWPPQLIQGSSKMVKGESRSFINNRQCLPQQQYVLIRMTSGSFLGRFP